MSIKKENVEQKIVETNEVDTKELDVKPSGEIKEVETKEVTTKEVITKIESENKNEKDNTSDEFSTKDGNLEDFYKLLFKIGDDNASYVKLLENYKCKDINDTLFISELLTIHDFVSIDFEQSINKGNMHLNSLLNRVLDQKDTIKFNILNKVFDNFKAIYEPSYLIRYIGFSRNIKVVKTYGLLITIISLLCNLENRKNNKSSVATLTALVLNPGAIEFLKQFYKL